jgi:hypothetical protein
VTTSWKEQIGKHQVVRPAAIADAANGQLSSAVLEAVTNGKGDTVGHLEATAAKAWQAMVAAAKRDGIILDLTDSYRSLESQERLLYQRYDHADHGRGSLVYKNQRWYLKPGYAQVATPGTSNHGLGLAVDTKNESGPSLEWLEAYAHEFGFEWEVRSEVWHIHYWPGDDIPQAVLQSQEDDEMTPDQAAKFDKMDYAIEQLILPAVARIELALAKFIDAVNKSQPAEK